MLILTRKKGQSIVIDENIEIIVTAIDGDQVKIGVVAPKGNKILRKELLEEIQSNNKEAITGAGTLNQLRGKISFSDIAEK
ncbi:hypothetical protein D3C87_1966310 [compost metagenome]